MLYCGNLVLVLSMRIPDDMTVLHCSLNRNTKNIFQMYYYTSELKFKDVITVVSRKPVYSSTFNAIDFIKICPQMQERSES